MRKLLLALALLGACRSEDARDQALGFDEVGEGRGAERGTPAKPLRNKAAGRPSSPVETVRAAITTPPGSRTRVRSEQKRLFCFATSSQT